MSNRISRKPVPVLSFSQVSAICEAYGIGSLIKVMKRIEDTANINIPIITKTGKYVIKIFTCEPKRFDFILNTLIKLQLNKLPVSIPLQNKAGSYFLEIDPLILQISSFICGYPFNYSIKQAVHSGRMLHNFHDALADTENYVKPIASLYPSTDILQNGIAKLKKINDGIFSHQIESIIDLYDEIEGKWEISKENLPKTIIHGDWHQKNLIFNDSEEVCGITDFEFMTRAERIFDVAYSLWRLRIDQGHLEAAKAFMEGYGTLTYEEIQYLPLEISRIIYYYICSSVLSHNPNNELPNNLRSHYPFMKWILSIDGQSIIRDLCNL